MSSVSGKDIPDTVTVHAT